MILSTPLSLVLAKIFILVPPVIAPDAPRDLGPVNKANIINKKENISSIISNALISSPFSIPTYYKVGLTIKQPHKKWVRNNIQQISLDFVV